MKTLITSLLLLVINSVAHADYLECTNTKQKQTDIGFYNHYGNITFQLSAPYKDDFLYVVGNCDSDNESHVGLPYTCEPAVGETNVVGVKLIQGAGKKPTAEITTTFDDGSSTKELIPCQYFN